jgi:lipoyl(octanoyl) transferase
VRSEALRSEATGAAIQAPSLPFTLLPSPLTVRELGLVDYEPTLRAMQEFTAQRSERTSDELWLLEHRPVYTLGVAARAEHLPAKASAIPIVKSDRGGQITYHGPGQLVAYVLLDMRRRHWTVRALVRLMELTVIDLCAAYDVTACGRIEAPGVYVGQAKVAALGLRIKHGCCYHGIALNVDMDLTPFRAIDPCGYPGLDVTQLRDLGAADSLERVGAKWIDFLAARLQ